MALKNCVRLSITLNKETLAELDRRARKIACPRSVYIATALHAKWQQEDNFANMPMLMNTMSDMARVIDELKADPELRARANADPRIQKQIASLPDENGSSSSGQN